MRDGDDYVINGSKMFITNGTWADVVLLFARSTDAPGHKGVSAFLVPTDTPGLTRRTIHGKLGLRGQATAELVFEDVRVPASRDARPRGQGLLRGHVGAGQGPDVGRGGLRRHRPGRLDAAVRYAGEREQFGRPIAAAPAGPGADQRHRRGRGRGAAADLAGRRPRSTAGCRSPPSPPRPSSSPPRPPSAPRTTPSRSSAATATSTSTRSGKLLRDARVMTLYEGTSQIQKLLIGRALTGVSAF